MNNIAIQPSDTAKITKTIKIKGMMCEKCEHHVKTALEAIPVSYTHLDVYKRQRIVILTDNLVYAFFGLFAYLITAVKRP